MGKNKKPVRDVLDNIFPPRNKLGSLLATLGPGARVPVALWDRGAFFFHVADTDWRKFTADHTIPFPATLRPDKDTHPLYVLDRNGGRLEVCPTSSQCWNRKTRYIPKNSVLEHTEYVMLQNSYLVETYRLQLGAEVTLSCKPRCMGVFSPERLAKRV